MENNITMVQIEINNQKVDVQVYKNLPYSARVACAKVIAEETVNNQGEYDPWNGYMHSAMFILTKYTDFQFPEGWGSNDLVEFVEHNEGYTKIISAIDQRELEQMKDMANLMIDYRKEYAIHNGFERLLRNANEFVERLTRLSESDPEMLDTMVGMFVDKFGALKEKMG